MVHDFLGMTFVAFSFYYDTLQIAAGFFIISIITGKTNLDYFEYLFGSLRSISTAYIDVFNVGTKGIFLSYFELVFQFINQPFLEIFQ